MQLCHYRLDEKGDIRELGNIRELRVDEVPIGPAFVVLHTTPDYLGSLLNQYSAGGVMRNDVRFLVVSQEPASFRDEHVRLLAGVGRVIPWSLETINTRRGERPIQWKWQRLRRLLNAVAAIEAWGAESEPQWSLLEAPKVPEDLLACYVAVSLGYGVDEAWKASAVAEFRAYESVDASDSVEFSKEGLARAIIKVGAAVVDTGVTDALV